MEGESLTRRLTRVISTIAEGLEFLCDDAHVHAAPYGASEIDFFRAQAPSHPRCELVAHNLASLRYRG